MSKPSVLKNTAIVGAFTMLSRLLGLVREMLQSRLIGAGVEQSAFTLAFAIPNMARKLFGEGALTAAFVPVFKGEAETMGLAKAARLARAVMTMVLLLLGCVVCLGCLGGLACLGGLTCLNERARLIVKLIVILLPYMLAICGAAFGMGVLNALGRFKASGFMPALLNVIWIATLGVLVLMPGLEVVTRTVVVSVAIMVGGFIQMGYMFRCMAKAGVTPKPLFRGWDSGKVRLVWRNLGIAAAGAGAVQVNYALDQVLAQLAAPWAAGVIGYAERLMDLPLGVIGVAFGTVLLPTLAGHFAKHDVEGARLAMACSVQSMMFLMIPSAVGLAVLAPEVTCVIYQGGSFDATSTVRVARALAVYAVGLGFFGLQKSLIPWFQSQNDMKTPLRVSVMTVCLNATLNVLAVWLLPIEWRHVGLAASTVLCAAVGTWVLVVLASRRNGGLGLVSIVKPLLKMLVSALVMGVVLVEFRSLCLVPRVPILELSAFVAVGGIAYAVSSLALFGRSVFRRFCRCR